MTTILVAADAPTLRREVISLIAGPDVDVVEAFSGPDALAAAHESDLDLVVVDMQMGSMGGIAVCIELRLQESAGALDHVPVLLLLDRRPDVFLARRAGAEGWVVKPLDPLRLRRAVEAVAAGGTFEDESYQPVPVLSGAPPRQAAPPLPA